MIKQTSISLAAFQRQNGKWAIATRAGQGDKPKIFSANMARAIALVLRGQVEPDLRAGSFRTADYYAKWVRANFVESLIPDICDQLESLAALADRENGIDQPWIIRGEVLNDGGKGKRKLH